MRRVQTDRDGLFLSIQAPLNELASHGTGVTSRPGRRTQEVLAMRAIQTIASGTRHVLGVGLQALLIAAILGLAAPAMSAV
jgi:hypothetical protein